MPKIINIMPITIDALFFDDPNMEGKKKTVPASIQSNGENLCNLCFFIFSSQVMSLSSYSQIIKSKRSEQIQMICYGADQQ